MTVRTRCEALCIDGATIEQPNTADTTATMAAAHIANAPRSWIQVARVGVYRGHSAGPFEFNSNVFNRIIDNFRRTKNQAVPVDFEHATEAPPGDGSIAQSGAPATGWIVDLDNRGDRGLWALVEWLEPGLSLVRAKRYRFFSPTVAFNAIDGATGERVGPMLLSGALTNRPFLDGMAEVTASANNTRGASTTETHAMEQLEKLITALRVATGRNDLTADNAPSVVAEMRDTARNATAQLVELRETTQRQLATSAVAELVDLKLIDDNDGAREAAVKLHMQDANMFGALFTKRRDDAKAALMKRNAAAPTTDAKITDAQRAALSSNAAGADPKPAGNDANIPAVAPRSERVTMKAREFAEKDPARYGRRGDPAVPNSDAYKAADKAVPAN